MVMHGGLFSRDGVTLRELVEIDRNRQPPEEGAWSTLTPSLSHHHSHTLTLSLSHSHTLTLTPSHPHTLTLSLSHSHTLTPSPSPSYTLTPSPSHTHTSHPHSHTLTLTIIYHHTLTLTHSHPHTLTITHSGMMCDLLWSDPQFLPGRGPSKRGVGVQFGPNVTDEFCSRNGIGTEYRGLALILTTETLPFISLHLSPPPTDLVIRSHEVKQDGYEVAHDGKCITVFSAPNYWYTHTHTHTHTIIFYMYILTSFQRIIMTLYVLVSIVTRWVTKERSLL